jgi:ABC-2 type transport system permease protein
MIKEVKDLLRDPKILVGMIIFPALVLPLMGAVVNVSVGSTVERASGNLTVYVIDQDGGSIAVALQQYLRSQSVDLINATGSPGDIVKTLAGGASLIQIPPGFSQNITNHQQGDLIIFTDYKQYSTVEFLMAQRANLLITNFGKLITQSFIIIEIPGTDPNSVLNPISVNYQSVIKGTPQPISPSVLQNVVQIQSLIGPLVIMLVLVVAMQVAATTMAVEKEAKTLETLLTLPVSRLNILFGKLVGSIAIALLATVANVLAFNYYIGAVLGSLQNVSAGINISQLGLAPTLEGYALLSLSLFGSLISALALALIIGALSQDVRGAQSLVGIIIVPVFLPALFLMFGDITTLPIAIQSVLYLIPFTYPALATQALFTGNFGPIYLGLVYMAAFTFATLYIAAKVFSTERIMTARLTFNWRKVKLPD